MSFRIEWTPSALQSLLDVYEYTCEEFGENQMKKLRRKIDAAIRLIATYPQIGSVESYSEKVGIEIRGLVVISQIIIIYSVMPDFVQTEYIKNSRLDDETMLWNMGIHI